MSISETGLLKSLGGTLECVARVSTILRHIPPARVDRPDTPDAPRSLNLPTAKTTDSGADIRLYKKLNIRPKLEPCEKFARPITSSQEIGWGVVIPKD